jgi:Skp family chaperone for outer membrane proteins
MRKEIIIEIEKVVSDIAKKDGYTFIFNDTVILYGEKESNVTEQVLKALNESFSAKK